jgi:hypothetical protein
MRVDSYPEGAFLVRFDTSIADLPAGTAVRPRPVYLDYPTRRAIQGDLSLVVRTDSWPPGHASASDLSIHSDLRIQAPDLDATFRLDRTTRMAW